MENFIINEEISLIIKPCPWCGKTPNIQAPLLGGPLKENTWIWNITCQNSGCSVNPKSKDVVIRNTGKKSRDIILHKIEKLVDSWNLGNPVEEYERTVIYLKITENIFSPRYSI